MEGVVEQYNRETSEYEQKLKQKEMPSKKPNEKVSENSSVDFSQKANSRHETKTL